MPRLALEVEEKKIEIEEQMLALETEEDRNKRITDERAIMFIDPTKMDEKPRKYWELTSGDILAKFSGGGGNGGGSDNGGATGNARVCEPLVNYDGLWSTMCLVVFGMNKFIRCLLAQIMVIY